MSESGRIEKLTREHVLDAFDCGQPDLNNWLLKHALQNRGANAAQGYVTEALQWLIDDGVVDKFDVRTEIVFPSRLNVGVVAYRSAAPVVSENFAWVWSELDANAI